MVRAATGCRVKTGGVPVMWSVSIDVAVALRIVTLMGTGNDPATMGVPETCPLTGLRDKPCGRFVAAKTTPFPLSLVMIW